MHSDGQCRQQPTKKQMKTKDFHKVCKELHNRGGAGTAGNTQSSG